MKADRYSMSFTTGGLFHRESVRLATLFMELGTWDAVRDRVLSENILQARTQNTAKRVCREVCSRLKTLEPKEFELLINSAPQEQGYLLWLAVCRRYKFIADFAVEIIRERYLSLKADLHYEDFDSFFNKKSEWHRELEEIKPVTRNKLRQILFKILREAGLIGSDNSIIAAMPSPRLLDVISRESRRDLLLFPIFETDL